MKRLAVALVAVLAISRAPLSAQTHADSAYRHSVVQATDSIRASVLPAASQYCAVKGAAGYMKTACAVLSRQLVTIARADSAFLAAIRASTIPPSPIPSPTPTPAPSGMVTEIVASGDFNDGTFGVFSHADANGGADVVVVDDPTHQGHGKVVAMHYKRDSSEAPGQGIDRNRGIGFDYQRGVHLGETVVFEGDLYMPNNPNLANIERFQRKLLYWQRDPAGDGPTGHGFFTYVLSARGMFYSISNVYIPLSGASDEQAAGGGTLNPDHWQHIKYEVRPNSTLSAKDGLVRLTLDGVKVYETTTLSMTDPAWTVDPTKLRLRYFLIGDQVNSDLPYDEWRYWDNVVLTVTRKP